MIRLENVGYTYPRGMQRALCNVSCTIEEGAFRYVLGPSGSGKTTLFRMLFMDLLPTQGKMEVFGQDVSQLSADGIAELRRDIGVVFQDFRLLNHLTVRENVALPLTLHGALTDEQNACVDEILGWVGLGNKMAEYPQALSGGEQQRVAIARAVVHRPKLLIADEPTGNVDPAMGQRIMHLFTQLGEHGTTVVIATHDQQLLQNHPAPTIVLEHGQLVSAA